MKKEQLFYTVYDTLLLLKNYNELKTILEMFKKNSILNFISEYGKKQFLDVLIKKENNKLKTSVLKKTYSIR